MASRLGPICGNPECGRSTGIHEGITCGTGDLDDNGFWEFPCDPCERHETMREERNEALVRATAAEQHAKQAEANVQMLRGWLREATTQRDRARASLNKIANWIGEVHEDDKIVSAVKARIDKQDQRAAKAERGLAQAHRAALEEAAGVADEEAQQWGECSRVALNIADSIRALIDAAPAPGEPQCPVCADLKRREVIGRCSACVQRMQEPQGKLDIRPRCIRCGERWMPTEGIDAQKAPCLSCVVAAIASKEDPTDA